MLRALLLFGCIATTVTALVGCGGGNRLSVYPVRGKVLVDGKPQKGIRVYFWPEEGAADVGAYCPQGETDENGEYVLTTYEDGDGAPPGQYRVTLVWPKRFNPFSNRWEGDRFRGRYDDPKSSRFRITIGEEPTVVATIKVSIR